MPTAGRINDGHGSGYGWKAYAAGGPYDLVADSPDGKSCAREIRLLAAGNLTHAFFADGVTDAPLLGLPVGYVHTGQTSGISPTVAVVVYW